MSVIVSWTYGRIFIFVICFLFIVICNDIRACNSVVRMTKNWMWKKPTTRKKGIWNIAWNKWTFRSQTTLLEFLAYFPSVNLMYMYNRALLTDVWNLKWPLLHNNRYFKLTVNVKNDLNSLKLDYSRSSLLKTTTLQPRFFKTLSLRGLICQKSS